MTSGMADPWVAFEKGINHDHRHPSLGLGWARRCRNAPYVTHPKDPKDNPPPAEYIQPHLSVGR